jgi:hypothetical protein
MGDFLIDESGIRVSRRTDEVELVFLAGRTVVEIRDGDRIVFEAGAEPEPRLYADVGSPVFADRDGKTLRMADLMGRTVASGSASSNGVLLLTFTDGATLRCSPNPEYEAWQVVGGKPESLVVCLPGGELAIWDDTPPIPLDRLRERDPTTAAALDEMLERFNLPRPDGFPPPDGEQN